ncbi:PREDICTED: probable 3-hydroxyisobutyrate dehydrogenase-like 2, mitochondrial [Brassica oleracea var. oleracea]|uniref:6-phosphogluconate dehydrogenase NADP-binding domain-containing protein n=1 Tax=Brassica oleracea var. oleracea TaxID=109376 RepID=A0A0D3DAF8_BRAOL|nr:PREDICTED: probable 3-hydroxyisobutyrate dehydrogenase-like 2, mitochondrial [Brassica oleracea var. oleracea]
METPYPKLITPSTTRIGWIGIGIMGSAMVSHTLAAGYSVTVYARDLRKSKDLQTKGARTANTPRGLAEMSDVVFTIVGNANDVRSLLLGPDGVLPGLKPGGVTVDMTSSQPELAREIHAEARRRYCWAVDAPVSGGDAGAREGTLAIFAGGDSEIVELLCPVMKNMGTVKYMGGAGSGQSCKIGNQICAGSNLVGLAEGMVFAEKAGLDPKKWLDAVKDGAAGSAVMRLFGEMMAERDYKATAFAEYIVKDLGMAADEEEGVGDVAAMPGTALSKQLFSGMVANGDGKLGIQGVVSVIRRLNGMS